ncbi:hypothetical protein ACHAXT_010172 [Thalassiosira profunda]
MTEPSVDPSDWATRRKRAMARARELRSKTSDAADDQSLASIASKSELQRQRRIRQLEATQRLLDGQGGGFGFNEQSPSGRLTRGYNHDEQPVGKASRRPNGDEVQSQAHSIISQKHLGRIHRRYQTPTAEIDSVTAKLDRHASLGRYADAEEDYLPSSSVPKTVVDTSTPTPTARQLLSEDTTQYSARGRGRGRRKSPLGTASSLGDLSRSSNPFSPHAAPEAIKDSSSTHRSHSSKAKVGESEALALQRYLKSRQVPDFKEGECEKLALLRQRLVARRRKRQTGSAGDKENAKPDVPTSAVKSSDKSPVKPVESDESRTLERLDPNEFSAKDFQLRHGKTQHSVSSPPRVPRSETVGDRSPLSYTQSQKGASTMDDEDSVVDIELIQCDSCQRSFAPKVYAKHFDADGQPKCVTASERRPVFNSAKARIKNNANLNKDEQLHVLQVNRKVSKELSRKLSSSKKRKSKTAGKWREESAQFREAMKTNRLISKGLLK